ncbi:hypothetical protein SUDANB176_07345 [Streptomyces sp. enrichment culture]
MGLAAADRFRQRAMPFLQQAFSGSSGDVVPGAPVVSRVDWHDGVQDVVDAVRSRGVA